MKKRNPFFVIAALVLTVSLPGFVNAQDEEDERKMIREVIDVQVDRPVTPVTPVTEDPNAHKKKGKKKHEETPPEEIAPVDSGGTIPAPIDELKKRGAHWVKKKDKNFTKSEAVVNGSAVETTVTVPYKPKELNPQAPVDGKITMTVVIDCKVGKYRYTVKDIQHVANKADFSGGDVFEDVAKPGSLYIPDPQWKKIKSFAVQKANEVANSLKASMKEPVKEKKDEW
jgi:hypothetical protein